MISRILTSVVLYKSNRDDFEKLLNSIISSSCENLFLEVFFLDNSPLRDNFIEKRIAESNYENKNNKVIFYYIFTGKNLGFGSGHNYVFNNFYKKQNFDYFLILNPDVYFNKNLLKDLSLSMKNNNNIGLSSVKILNIDGSIQYNHRKFPNILDIFIRLLSFIFRQKRNIKNRINIIKEKTEMREFYNSKESYFKAEMISGCFMFFKIDIFKKLNGFDESYFMYYEDLDISKRCYKITNNAIFKNLEIYHKWNRDSVKDFRIFKIQLNSFLKYFFIKPFFNYTKSLSQKFKQYLIDSTS